MKLTDVFKNILTRGHTNLEISAHEPVIIKQKSPIIEKRYRKMMLTHYQEEHPIRGFFRGFYYTLTRQI